MELYATGSYAFGQSRAAFDRLAPCATERVCSDDGVVVGGYADERPFVATVAECEDETTLDATV